jgi:hypothetical protein
MKRRISLLIAAATMVAVLAFPTIAAAHNRALVWVHDGEKCVQVGSLKSVYPGPAKDIELDLDPTADGDNIGTSLAALQGGSALEKGACPAD